MNLKKLFENLDREKAIWASLRIGLGWIILWAFLDKTFGLGYATASENAWINGGSPTTGFLSFATAGPFSGFFDGLAGVAAVDWLFMIGLLFIGGALILGIGNKIAGIAGAFMMLLMYLARIPPENNPILDDHLIYLIVFVGIVIVKPGKWLGLGEWWANTKLVKRFPFLE